MSEPNHDADEKENKSKYKMLNPVYRLIFTADDRLRKLFKELREAAEKIGLNEKQFTSSKEL
jgi:hypothetical protein